MKFLYLIPARGGSRGVPGKNIKALGGKPLIFYSIDIARNLSEDQFICVSTDSPEVIRVVEGFGLKVPFIRPAHLATDSSGMHGVVQHALEHYRSQGHEFDAVILLQPTSPFRRVEDVKSGIAAFHPDLDMVVSVMHTTANPYFTLFEENESGFLEQSKLGNFQSRQELPEVFQYNGAVYVINSRSIGQVKSFAQFKKIKKFVMDELHSMDVDTPLDWAYCEFLIEKKYI